MKYELAEKARGIAYGGLRVLRLLQISLTLPNGLGIAAQVPRHLLHAMMSQLDRINRRISPPILFRQPSKEAIHLPSDFRRIGYHATLFEAGQAMVEKLRNLTNSGKLMGANS